jgi:hypothetical protein
VVAAAPLPEHKPSTSVDRNERTGLGPGDVTANKALSNLENALSQAALARGISWQQAAQILRAIDKKQGAGDWGAWLALVARDVYSERQLDSLPLVFAAGASPWEAIALGVHGFNRHGEDLSVIPDRELEQRARVTLRFISTGDATSWLQQYGHRVLAEQRRRQGMAA